jgi:hypothetical protein
MALVLDTQFPPPYEVSSAADYGTVCHYAAQTSLPNVVNKNEIKPPSKDQIASAIGLMRGREAMSKALEAAVKAANDRLPVLPKGIGWVSEYKANDPTLLPARVGRDGKTRGYSGSIDLMAEDRSVVVDYKFTSMLPTCVNMEYLWQMASYHILTGAPKTLLVFTLRDGAGTATAQFDWMTELGQAFIAGARNFISFCGNEDFSLRAYFRDGDHCKYCKQKARCMLQQQPASFDVRMANSVSTTCNDEMLSLINMARLANNMNV